MATNDARRKMYNFLREHINTAHDIFWDNYTIDESDFSLLQQEDIEQAGINACAVLAYRQIDSSGCGNLLNNPIFFVDMVHYDEESVTTHLCNQLALEYGRQLHTQIAFISQREEF